MYVKEQPYFLTNNRAPYEVPAGTDLSRLYLRCPDCGTEARIWHPQGIVIFLDHKNTDNRLCEGSFRKIEKHSE
ncbi:hypothetical protein ACFYTQ_05715 [Nocardia sp. NPDC004068]|uniref:hypothetical protein n=1 Tax=Nocardia sp. NPDC004068 TaxID=3364303 RepID=UPI00367B9763